MQIGAQLYTVYEHTQTLEGIDQALAKVAAMGYRAVQVSGTCAYDPYWLRDTLQKYDLTCVLTHVDRKPLLADPEKVVQDHAAFGCKHIGLGSMPNDMRGTLDGYKAFRDTYLPVALRIRDAGGKFLYHNHWFEFDPLEGKDVIERMLEDFPEDSVDFTLDLGWAAYAGKDVVELIRTLKGRLSRIHLKDYADKPADGSIDTPAYLRPIYEGKLPYDDYIAALKEVGCEYALVEQDWCYTEDPFDCLKRSYENIMARGVI